MFTLFASAATCIASGNLYKIIPTKVGFAFQDKGCSYRIIRYSTAVKFFSCQVNFVSKSLLLLAQLFDKSFHEQGNSPNSLKHVPDDINGPLSPMSLPAQKQLKYSPGIVNGPGRESAAFINQTRKMIPLGQLPMKKLVAIGQAGNGKLWRWKRSHHQWLVQFKWKWQKPWRLSEWIRHSDETIIRSRPRPQALPHRI